MNIFSLILTILSVIYIFLGLYVIRLDKSSRLNRLFFALNLSLFIWSFATVFYISASDLETCIFWYKLSSVGLFLFTGLVLHFFLEYTQKKELLNKWWIYIILYLPSIVFSYMEITSDIVVKAYFLGSNGWAVSARTDSVWFWASIAYYIIYINACIVLSYRLQKTAQSQRERKQARMLFVAAIISLVTGLVIMVIVSIIGFDIPDISPISGAVWSILIFYSIVKHKLMTMTPSLIAENLFQTIIDSVILANPKGFIYSINPETQRLLGYDEKELVGEPLERLFLSDGRSENRNISELLRACPIQNMERVLISKTGVNIPIILSISECRDDYDTLIGYILASRDITEYKKREEEIKYLSYHDQLTGLYNRRFYEEELKRLDTKRNLPISIIMGDVNGLKIINDSIGHVMGDELLKKVAQVMANGCRADDIIARLGGDEFVVLLPKTDHIQAERIIKRFNELLIDEKVGTLAISVSFGYQVKNNESEKIHDMIKAAEDQMYKYKVLNSSSTRRNTIDLIMNALYEKNHREMLHSKRVGEICEAIALKMNFENETIYRIKVAGLMHDIGKIGIEDETLNKPQALDADEWVIMKKHPEIGQRILSAANEFSEIGDFIFEHHEKWDGTGYPRGLKGDEILLQARIIAVADSYDAMTSYRKYGKKLSQEEAIDEIKRCSGTQFDPAIVRTFIEKVLGKEWA